MNPLLCGFDSRIVLRQTREDHALESRVSHRAITAKSTVGTVTFVRRTGIDLGRRDFVVEPAVVDLVCELRIVELAVEVLASRNERECSLNRWVARPDSTARNASIIYPVFDKSGRPAPP